MTKLNLRLLGEFQASVDATPIEDFATDKVRALLAYLAVEADRAHARTQLATLLWGEWDEAAAKSNLRKALFRLRKALGDSVTSTGSGLAEKTLTITRNDVGLHSDSAEIDFHQFTDLLQSNDINDLEQAADLYRGDLLAGMALPDAPAFEDWLIVQREQLQQQLLTLLYQLGELYLAQDDYESVHAVAARQLALEPWREAAHRQIMRAYDAAGQRSEALAQYERCVAVLDEELGVEPSAETEALVAAIRGEQLLTTHLFHFAPPQTLFVGRAVDVNRVIARLNAPDVRLVTLTGTGGVGKTRLAIEAVTRSLGNRTAYFIPLATVTTQDGIWQLLGEQLAIKPSPRGIVIEDILAFLRERAPLLVFDNYEQLLPDTRCIERILADAPDVQILVTSRAPLKLRAEWRLPLDGLDVPPIDAAEIADFPAVELLVTTGQQVQPELQLSAENTPFFGRICRALAGMPLALEMAGSWLNLFTLQLLADQIESNLDFLVATRTDMPERHRSLRAIFDYSTAQLRSAEHTLLKQLTIFHGDFSFEAALTILTASPLLFNALIDHALVQRHGENRFGLHPVLYSFLREDQLATEFDTKTLHQQHAHYYLQRIALLDDANVAASVSEIGRDLANVTAAWNWAVTQCDTDLIANALAGQLTYYEFRGSYETGLKQFATAAERLSDPVLVNRLRLAEATCLQKLGDLDRAVALVEQIVRSDAVETQLPALIRLARLYERRADHEEAIATAQQALALAEPQSAEAAQIWRILGAVYQYRGSLEKRLEAHRQTLSINETLGDELQSAESHTQLSLIYKDTGQYEEGINHAKQAIAIAERLGHRERLAQYVNNLGRIYVRQGEYELAQTCYEQVQEIATALNHKQFLTISIGNLGSIFKIRRDYATALRHYERAIEIAEQIGDKASQAVFLGNTGNAYMDIGQYDRAIIYFERAATIDGDSNAPSIGRHLGNTGDALKFQHRYADALPYFEQAIPYLRKSDATYFLCWVLVSYAECLFEVGRFDEARAANLEGEQLATEIGREIYQLFSTLLAARLDARNGNRLATIERLKNLRKQESDLEYLAEIDFAIWQISGEQADLTVAQESNMRLYNETKRERYRTRLTRNVNNRVPETPNTKVH